MRSWVSYPNFRSVLGCIAAFCCNHRLIFQIDYDYTIDKITGLTLLIGFTGFTGFKEFIGFTGFTGFTRCSLITLMYKIYKFYKIDTFGVPFCAAVDATDEVLVTA